MSLSLSTFLQLKVNNFICPKLGWRFTFFYLVLLGKLYFSLNRLEKQKIEGAIEDVFAKHMSPSEIRSIAKDVFKGIFYHYYEKIFNAYATSETLRLFLNTHTEADGLDEIAHGLSKGKGVLLVTGHFGAVELIPAFLGHHDFPVSIVARFNSDRLRVTSQQQAANFRTRIIDADRTPNIPKAVFQSLRDNRVVITQCDEMDEWRPSPSDQLFFLGKRICMDRTMSILSKRTGAMVVFGLLHRNKQYRYKFVAESETEAARRFHLPDGAPAGTIALKFLEHYIYQYPENWYLWKKYPAMQTVSEPTVITEKPTLVPVMKPSFGKTS